MTETELAPQLFADGNLDAPHAPFRDEVEVARIGEDRDGHAHHRLERGRRVEGREEDLAGSSQEAQQFFRAFEPGDVVELEIEKIGLLRNVVGEKKE